MSPDITAAASPRSSSQTIEAAEDSPLSSSSPVGEGQGRPGPAGSCVAEAGQPEPIAPCLAEADQPGPLKPPVGKALSRSAWQWPWGYQECATLVAAIVAGGFVAQWLMGPLPGSLLAWPVNAALFSALIALALLARPLKARRIFRFLTCVPLSVTLMGALGVFAIVMGLIPQLAPEAALPAPDPVARLGLLQVTSSWPFAILYLLTLAALGCTLAAGFAPRRRVFALNHLGLWLILLAAGLGAADRQREIVRVPEGGVEWRSTKGGEVKELDLAIRLDDFIMEEYPARLVLVDPSTGQGWPSATSPALFQIDLGNPSGRLDDYQIEVIEYLSKASPMGDGSFIPAAMNGPVQAAKIKVANPGSGESFEGWVSGGNGFVPPRPLRLGKGGSDAPHGLVVSMARPEPRLFLSKVKIFTKQGQEIEADVRVNHPLKAGDWLIYQRDYDTSAGPMSAWSGFELIRDRWLPLAYAGFILWAAGCLGMIIKGRG